MTEAKDISPYENLDLVLDFKALRQLDREIGNSDDSAAFIVDRQRHYVKTVCEQLRNSHPRREVEEAVVQLAKTRVRALYRSEFPFEHVNADVETEGG